MEGGEEVVFGMSFTDTKAVLFPRILSLTKAKSFPWHPVSFLIAVSFCISDLSVGSRALVFPLLFWVCAFMGLVYHGPLIRYGKIFVQGFMLLLKSSRSKNWWYSLDCPHTCSSPVSMGLTTA